jgi:hypothetical protein
MIDATEFISASTANANTSMFAARSVRRTSKQDFRNEMKIEMQDIGKWNLLTLRTDCYLDVKAALNKSTNTEGQAL